MVTTGRFAQWSPSTSTQSRDRNRSAYNDSSDQLVCFLANSLSSMEFHRTITRAIFASLICSWNKGHSSKQVPDQASLF